MKAFFNRYKKLHIWLLVSIGLVAAWWFGRHCRPVMNVLADRITYPLRAAIGRLCFLVDFSVIIGYLKNRGYDGAVTIEREISGEKQIEDIRHAKEILLPLIG